MIPILLGRDADSRNQVSLSPDLFRTHMHLIGATGTGKTNAIQILLRQIMLQSGDDKSCLFVIDPMGNLSMDLLRFMADDEMCPAYVRDRLVYFELARDDVVLPFNPLTHDSEAQRYYQTMRSVDIVLRAWSAQDLSQQPRLLQWTYKAFCAAAMMGLPISMCRCLLHPGTFEHDAILNRIPGDIRVHWKEILNARGNEATRILESTRNRLDPFFESPNLRHMFGVAQSRFDCERFIANRNIVIVNLAKYGRVPQFICDTVGALFLNEIFETASRVSTRDGREAVDPTYVLMDEFQKYVSVDIEDALPTVRQMGLRMLLAHQSFSQLERDDVDLTQMIWQARSRLIFANNAQDADIVAEELAKLTHDKMKIKHELKSTKQLIKEYRKEWLNSISETEGTTGGYSENQMQGSQENTSRTEPGQKTDGRGTSGSSTFGYNNSDSNSRTTGRSETMVPVHERFEETSSVTFESFEEQTLEWGRNIRQLKTGEAFVQLANTPGIKRVNVYFDPVKDTPRIRERVDELLEQNFSSDIFISAADARAELEQSRRKLLTSPISVPNSEPDQAADSEPSPFEL